MDGSALAAKQLVYRDYEYSVSLGIPWVNMPGYKNGFKDSLHSSHSGCISACDEINE